MKEKRTPKVDRTPWFRSLLKSLGGFPLPMSYCFRRWLFEMVKPENLTVVQFQYVPGKELYALMDPDMNRTYWCFVKIGEDVFQPLPEESLKAIISPKTCTETPH